MTKVQCYLCEKKTDKPTVVPRVWSGKAPKGFRLCISCATIFWSTHNGWKNVKRTITELKKNSKVK